ncbi:MAG TPA: sugar-binding domain-containing protein, partial [Microbacteriaceae bacterium]|nr:sugar-binding domain-containing protein [Microbacteriaceae bacterium]
DEQSLLGSLGSAGARYLEATLSEHEHLGISPWSSTLLATGAVGDVCLRFFDADGRPTITELDERVLGIGRQTLLAVPRRIGIAGGERKHAAIRGALLGGWINILITDKQTALALLKD